MSRIPLVPTLGHLVAAAAVLGSVQAAESTTIGEIDDEAVIVISGTRSETARDSVPTIVEVVEATASGPITEKLGFTVAANGLVTDGFSAQNSYSADGDPKNFEDDGFQRLGFNGRLFFSTETVGLSGGLLVLTGEEEFDGFAAPDDEDSEVAFDSIRLTASTRVMVAERGTRVMVAERGTRVIVAERVDVAGDIAYSIYDRDSGGDSEFESKDIYLAGRGIFDVNEMVELTGAMDWRQQVAETSSIDDDADIFGIWGQSTIAWEALEAQVVLRHDIHSREGDAATWRLSTSYGFLDDTVVVHATYDTGFRAPSLFELFSTADYGFGLIGNEDLEPEETSTYELGHRSQLNEQVYLCGDSLTDEHAAVYVSEPSPPDCYCPGDPGSPGGSWTNAALSLMLGVTATFRRPTRPDSRGCGGSDLCSRVFASGSRGRVLCFIAHRSEAHMARHHA